MYLFESETKINKTDQNAFDNRGFIEIALKADLRPNEDYTIKWEAIARICYSMHVSKYIIYYDVDYELFRYRIQHFGTNTKKYQFFSCCCGRYKMPSQNGPQISYDALLMNHFEFKIMCNKQTVKLRHSIFRLNRCGFIRTIGVLTVTCLKLFSHINLWFKVIHKDGAPFRMALIAHTLNLDTNQSFGIW